MSPKPAAETVPDAAPAAAPGNLGAGDRGATILEAGPPQMDAVRLLFRAYADGLQEAVCLRSFEHEVAGLPGAYARPHGRLLLALAGGRAAGCIGLRPAGAGTAELKRLYVVPDARGLGLGRALAVAALAAARQAGCRRVVLETLPRMVEARRLYRALGFTERGQDAASGVIACDLDLAAAIEAS